MSNLSGYDSEAVGFDSISAKKSSETSASTQTCEFGETGVGSQTNQSQDCGSTATPEALNAQDDVLREYPPPGLNEFLRKVVPSVIAQLDEKQFKESLYNSSDSEDEDVFVAQLFQEIKVLDVSDLGGGDQATSVLALSWSSAGNSLAVSVGKSQHEEWCTHDGLIRIYTIKRTAGDKFVHLMDINEKNCITVVKYHPSVSALLAYGTTSGEIVMCNLSAADAVDMSLTSPSGCHGSKRVSVLKWADGPLANTFLIMQINNSGKRRGASDQVLISAGSDGTINVWQVNCNVRIFETIVMYNINGSRKIPPPDITCFDFIKTYPLRPSEKKVSDTLFVVGSKSGALYLCKIKPHAMHGDVLDPVIDALDGHSSCLLDVAFSIQSPGLFASISIDSELRIYDVKQGAPLKIFHLESAVSCVGWLPHSPRLVLTGRRAGGVTLTDVTDGRVIPVTGLNGDVTVMDASQTGSLRIACGDEDSRVRVWELPSRHVTYETKDFDF